MALSFRLSQDAEYIAEMNRAVQELHHKLYPEYFKPFSYTETAFFLRKQFQEEGCLCFIAAYNGVDAGYALFHITEYQENPFRKGYRGIHIDQISIQPQYKRQGIGTGLMKAIEQFAVKENAAQVELSYWDLNEDAKRFYTSMGFNEVMHYAVKRL